jgi:hypothetical protein
MNQKIKGFHQDQENHWVAELECGHAQHVRHDPPWMERPWVITKEGRETRLGVELNCVRCDEAGEAVARKAIERCREAMIQAYESAGLSGLCEEGRFELALDALKNLDALDIAGSALKSSENEKG